ncbi:MAG: MFS transporter [Bacteroidia bacterium]
MKNKSALILLLAANIISGFAQGISMLAIPWYFTSMLGKNSFFGIVYLVITFASVFWSLYAGTLIDRHSRKKVFISINIAGAVILGSVAGFGFYTGNVPVSLVILVFGATIFIYNVHYPTLYAFGQEITEQKNYGKINSFIEVQGQATTMFSGAFGAILLAGTTHCIINIIGFRIHLPFDIVPWSLQKIFLMDGITYLIALVLIGSIKYVSAENLEIHTGSVKERIQMGIDFLKNKPELFFFGIVTLSIFIVLIVEDRLLMPLYVNNHLQQGADVYASSGIYYTIGAIFSGFFIRKIFKNTNAVKAIIVLMIITIIILLTTSFTRSIAVFFAFSLLIGLTNAGARILRITYLFERIPNNRMGRTGSVFSVISTLTQVCFIGVFSIPFFSIGSHVTWAYFIDTIFICVCLFVLVSQYKKLTSEKLFF